MADRTWLKPTMLLCSYGFFKDMKPSEAFLTPYLNSTYKNISHRVLSDEIYPVSTYSYFAFLFVVLMTTDFLRYKPLVVLESTAYLATRVILIWGQGIPIMQAMQVTYGLATATEIAYYSYIYGMVEKEHFQKVTSYTRLSVLLGKGIGDLTGQILLSTNTANLLQLNYVSLGSVTLAVVVSLFLPKVPGSVFSDRLGTFERFTDDGSNTDADSSKAPDEEEEEEISNRCDKCCVQMANYFRKILISFKTTYSDKNLLKWSLWWALSMCGGLQIEDYVMNLWSNLQGNNVHDDYNGAVFACGTLVSAICVFLFSFLNIRWSVLSEVIIGWLSIAEAVLVIVMSVTNNVYIAYGCYVIFRASFAFSLTVAR